MEVESSRVINVLPALVWTTHPDGTIGLLNQRWYGHTGLTSSEACSIEWQSNIHPGDASEVLERWCLILAAVEPGQPKARLRRFDDAYRWFLISCNPTRDETGQVLRWYAVNTDIDERNLAREALRSDGQDLRSIIDTIPKTAWSASADGYYDFVNQRWLDYSVLSLDQAQGWVGGL